ITFGTATGQVQTLADLQTALANLSSVTASLTGSAISFQVPAGSKHTSLAISADAALLTTLGPNGGTTPGAFTARAAHATRASLQLNYNDLLNPIDTLAKDSSYNGINLLFGDNLKIVYNENGTSSSTVKGVTSDSNGLGLAQLNGTQFQDNASIDLVIATLN